MTCLYISRLVVFGHVIMTYLYISRLVVFGQS